MPLGGCRYSHRSFSTIARYLVTSDSASGTRFEVYAQRQRPSGDLDRRDISCCGGLSEFTKILALATARGVRVVPHVWGSAVALATALQGIAIIPPIPYTHVSHPLVNDPALEYDQSPNPLRQEISDQQFALVDGHLPIPQSPGLGLTVDENAVLSFCD